jgi:hypothetical protein
MTNYDRIRQEKLAQMKKDLNEVTGQELQKVINDYIDTAFEYGYSLGNDVGYDAGYADAMNEQDDIDDDELGADEDTDLPSMNYIRGHKV